MKEKTPLVDEHLASVQGINEAHTDDFFYTRLKARMEKKQSQSGWSFPLKPAWVIGGLVLLLATNGVMLIKQNSSGKKETTSSLNDFAKSYDLQITPSY